jgi:replicative DNA helicase
MLVRNLIARPELGGYIRERINTEYLPGGDNSALLRQMMEVVQSSGRLNTGHVSDILDRYPNQQFARTLPMRAVSEDREAVDSYLDSLEEHSELERMRVLVAAAHLDLSRGDASIDQIKHELAEGIVRTGYRRGLRDIGEFGKEAKNMLLMAQSSQRPGRSVGFGPALDDYWWFEPGTISILAGRPGSGKTSLITSSIGRAATPENPEAFFSIEMPAYSIVQRLAAGSVGVPLHDLNRGRTDSTTLSIVMAEIDGLADRGIYVDEDVVSMDDILYRSMALPVTPRVIWVDYGEKVAVTQDTRGRRDLELGYIYTRGKAIAKRLKCHMVILAQLGRDVEAREDKWPTMSDISQSGAAEKDGDYVVLLMRPEYYISRGLSCRVLSEGDREEVCYCIVAKSRNGAVDTVRLRYNAKIMRFGEYED